MGDINSACFDTEDFRIGELAEHAGVTIRTVSVLRGTGTAEIEGEKGIRSPAVYKKRSRRSQAN